MLKTIIQVAIYSIMYVFVSILYMYIYKICIFLYSNEMIDNNNIKNEGEKLGLFYYYKVLILPQNWYTVIRKWNCIICKCIILIANLRIPTKI